MSSFLGIRSPVYTRICFSLSWFTIFYQRNKQFFISTVYQQPLSMILFFRYGCFFYMVHQKRVEKIILLLINKKCIKVISWQLFTWARPYLECTGYVFYPLKIILVCCPFTSYILLCFQEWSAYCLISFFEKKKCIRISNRLIILSVF